MLLKGSVDLGLDEDERIVRIVIEVEYEVRALLGTRRADGDLSPALICLPSLHLSRSRLLQESGNIQMRNSV